MGLFSFIGKAAKAVIGKVIRPVLSTATGGASELALGTVNALKAKKRTDRENALLQKAGLVTDVKAKLQGGAEGWGFSAPPKKLRIVGKKRSREVYVDAIGNQFETYADYLKYGVSEEGRRELEAERQGFGGKSRLKGTAGIGKGALDLKAISQLWHQQGKPGRWLDFIKANPIRKG